jgi:serine/threonine protein kinase
MHRGHLDIPASNISGGVELSAICTELSDIGYLGSYIMTHKALHPEGFVSVDLQAFCCQLIDTVNKCHQSKITHRNLCPSSVLVCRGHTFQVNQSVSNIVMKLCSFRLAALSKIAQDSENNQWLAPECDSMTRNTGVGYQPQSDLWGLGLLLYYIATCGQCPFMSHAHAKEAVLSDVNRRQCLEAHNLHNSSPMLYDLIERLVRPVHTRAPISLVRCHPFLWTTTMRRNILIDFTNTLTSPQQPQISPQRAQVIENMISSLNRFAPKFVFGADGWCMQMNKDYLPFVQPVSLRTDFWWSALHLLQAIRNQLLYPDALHAARYTRHTPHQFLNLYLKQTLDHDFPRLLVLLFELGVVHGRWDWDGDEANFMWGQ